MSKKEQLGLLVKQETSWRVETWLEEDDANRVQVEQRASFWVGSVTGKLLQLKVAVIYQDAARTLPRRELANVLGGHEVTREENGVLVPECAVYRVTLELQNMPQEMLDLSWRGKLMIHADLASPMARY